MTTWQALKKIDENGQTKLLIKKCRWCGTLFIKTSNKDKYCKKDCGKFAHLEQKAIFANKYRRQYPKKECLGTGGLSSHRRHNFKSEYNAIQNEKKRLKI